mgnify:CR=1 FL=1
MFPTKQFITYQVTFIKTEKNIHNLKKYFGLIKTNHLKKSVSKKLEQIWDEKELVIKKFISENRIPDKFSYNDFRNKTDFYRGTLRDLNSELEYSIVKEEKRIEKNQLILDLKAKVAKIDSKSRNFANIIKTQLIKMSDCPYCGKAMNDDCHADHIYPIFKGGISTRKNMVYICSNCNIKKGSKTLNQFIKKYTLDREFIESNLNLLDKDY